VPAARSSASEPPLRTERELEERLTVTDAHGNRMTLIRIRTIKTLWRSVGSVEVETARRYTLPGYGHVRRVSDTEFEVFAGRIRLRLYEAPAAT